MSDCIELSGKPRVGDWLEVLSDALCEGAPCTAQVTERWLHGVAFKRWTGERVFVRFSKCQTTWSGERKGKRWFGLAAPATQDKAGAL